MSQALGDRAERDRQTGRSQGQVSSFVLQEHQRTAKHEASRRIRQTEVAKGRLVVVNACVSGWSEGEVRFRDCHTEQFSASLDRLDR